MGESVSDENKKACQHLASLDRKAGGGNRTRMTSLEGWSFTTKLHPLYIDSLPSAFAKATARQAKLHQPTFRVAELRRGRPAELKVRYTYLWIGPRSTSLDTRHIYSPVQKVAPGSPSFDLALQGRGFRSRSYRFAMPLHPVPGLAGPSPS